MKATLKFSGVKAELPELTPQDLKAWQFESRPGGWQIATRTLPDGRVERRRFFYHRQKDRFWAKFVGQSDGNVGSQWGASIQSSDFYGQKIEAVRAGSAAAAQNDFTAQFPGKVRKILVAPGTEVDAGTPLLMVEAMKMEFAIKCETAGKVLKLLVQEGQQLTPGQKLLEFEARETK